MGLLYLVLCRLVSVKDQQNIHLMQASFKDGSGISILFMLHKHSKSKRATRVLVARFDVKA